MENLKVKLFSHIIILTFPTKNVTIPANRKSSANKSTNENTMISKIMRENSCPQNSNASKECPESMKKVEVEKSSKDRHTYLFL